MVVVFLQPMPGHIQLVVIRQADGAEVLGPRVTARFLLIPRGIVRSLLHLPLASLLHTVRSRRVLACPIPHEFLVLVALLTLVLATLKTPLPGNHVARYYPSGPINLKIHSLASRKEET